MSGHRNAGTQRHVWPSAIVMVNPQRQGAPEMTLPQRDEKIETLSPRCADKAFAHRIRQRSFHGRSVPIVDHETILMIAR